MPTLLQTQQPALDAIPPLTRRSRHLGIVSVRPRQQTARRTGAFPAVDNLHLPRSTHVRLQALPPHGVGLPDPGLERVLPFEAADAGR